MGFSIIEASLEVRPPTIRTDEKQRRSRRIEKRRADERRSEKRKSQKKEDAGARKGRKVAKHCVFPMICGLKNCTPLWREAHFEVKMYKAPGPDRLEVEMSKKRTSLWREAHFEVKMLKTPGVRTIFGLSDMVPRGRRTGLWTLSKVSKTWGFCSISKNDGRRGTLEEALQRCIFRGRCSTRDMFIRAVRRSGRWFPEKGCILEPQTFRFAEMILRDRCSTSYESLFRGRRSSLDRWTRKIAKRIGTRPSALHSTFHFWRKSRRIASFLMLSSAKIEEVSLNCCVFGVVKF